MRQSLSTHSMQKIQYIELRLHSSNEIAFPNDYNLKIFERINGVWIEIPEIPATRFPTGDVVLSPTTKLRESTFVDPDLKDHTRRYQLRIYVIGDMNTEEGIKNVAAYVDIELHPTILGTQG